MSVQQEDDDLSLLLSLQDRVLETPPPSPSAAPALQSHHSDHHLSDHASPTRRTTTGNADMSAFRDSVRDYLAPTTTPLHNHTTTKTPKSNDFHVERFSGLRIRNLSVSTQELNFSETRFIRLNAIRNSLAGDTISGCWATAGVLIENGAPRISSTAKKYSIWKLGCLDENVVSVFMFGEAYAKNCKEAVGTVFAFFNAQVRKDAKGNGFSLSVFSCDQIAKMGSSVDYGVCKAKRKDGGACNMVINKSRGIYCIYHKSNASQKYSVTRTELKGGNLRTAFRNTYQPEGIYMVNPLAEGTNLRKSKQPVKLLSVDGLKKALSNAGKVTTNARSQGIRFLTEVTGQLAPKYSSKESALPSKEIRCSKKRFSSSTKPASTIANDKQPEAKRRKSEQTAEKMIELEIFSSDGE